MKKYDVVALGELLIDFTQNGKSVQGNDLFEANPGGAPCNVLAMLSKLQKKVAFIGKVGNDMFGNLLKDIIIELGIDASAVVMDDNVKTTLAFVKTDKDGDRHFSFYRNPGADIMLSPIEVNLEMVKNATIFHFGTLSMSHEMVREATMLAVSTAKKAGALISFDPNLRKNLWDSLEMAKEQMWWGVKQCDVLKIEDEELKFLTDIEDETVSVNMLFQRTNIKIIFVTAGKHGSTAYCNGVSVHKDAFLNVKTIDTTGAGDTFCGSCLAYLLDNPISTLTKEQLSEMLIYGNAAAALVTTKKGSLRCMPQLSEVERLVNNTI